jgi:hypothetical protein
VLLGADDSAILIPLLAQGRWKRYEEELVKMHTKQQQLSMEQGLASKRQIFSRCIMLRCRLLLLCHVSGYFTVQDPPCCFHVCRGK